MPGGDRTGPMGLGPMTGRAAGYCAGYPVPGYMNPYAGRGAWGRGYFGRGRGFGRGGGRGRRNWYYATGLPGWTRAEMGLPAWGGQAYPYYGGPYGYPYGPEVTPKQEADMLKDQADMLKEQAKAMQEEIKSINERIKELESAAKGEKEKE